MLDLTIQDINTLLESLDAWEKNPTTTGFSDSLFSIMLSGIAGPRKGDPDYETYKEKQFREDEQRRLKAEREVSVRRDTVTLLRAKLITERNRLTNLLASETHA